jgi:putative ABC transport system permease protein
MFKNHLKTALRTFLRDRIYAGINVVSLTIGITVCLLILLFVLYERNFDRTYDQHIYRLGVERTEGGIPHRIAQSMFPMGPTLKNEFAEIEDYTQIVGWENVPLRHEDRPASMGVLFGAGPSFLTMFDFNMLNGDAATALVNPNSIVLTRRMAMRLFGNPSPMGKRVVHQGRDTVEYTVTGIIENITPQSHLQFDAVYSQSTEERPGWMENWSASWAFTYLKLADHTQAAALERKLPAYLKKYLNTETISQYNLFLQSVHDIHLGSTETGRDLLNGQKFDGTYVQLLAVVALFIFALAIINYINLSTARSFTRAKEVGIRKTGGASTFQIATQFLWESTLVSLLALAVSFTLVQVLLPYINEASGRSLRLQDADPAALVAFSLGVVLFGGIGAGIVPALQLSRLNPIKVLKGNIWTNTGSPLRHMLVVVQFTVAIGLCMVVLAGYQQFKFISNYKLGFNSNAVIVIPVSSTDRQVEETLIHQLRQVAGVKEVTGALRRLGNPVDRNDFIYQNNDGYIKMNCATMFVDYNYLSFYNIEFLAGRNLTSLSGNDRRGRSYVINETLAKTLIVNSSNPQAPVSSMVGKRYRHEYDDSLGTIVGIVRDFNFNSLHEPIQPVSIQYLREYFFTDLSVRLESSHEPRQTLAKIEGVWHQFLPDQPLQYHFLDEHLEQLYRADQQMGWFVACFTALALLISCMGLIGLAAFSTARRSKEIGIRKVLGATVASIISRLSMDFIKPVAKSILIAIPVAWYIIDQWLMEFAYRAEVPWWIYLLAAGTATGIALATVSWQTLKAAAANPVKSLRAE